MLLCEISLLQKLIGKNIIHMKSPWVFLKILSFLVSARSLNCGLDNMNFIRIILNVFVCFGSGGLANGYSFHFRTSSSVWFSSSDHFCFLRDRLNYIKFLFFLRENFTFESEFIFLDKRERYYEKRFDFIQFLITTLIVIFLSFIMNFKSIHIEVYQVQIGYN